MRLKINPPAAQRQLCAPRREKGECVPGHHLCSAGELARTATTGAWTRGSLPVGERQPAWGALAPGHGCSRTQSSLAPGGGSSARKGGSVPAPASPGDRFPHRQRRPRTGSQRPRGRQTQPVSGGLSHTAGQPPDLEPESRGLTPQVAPFPSVRPTLGLSFPFCKMGLLWGLGGQARTWHRARAPKATRSAAWRVCFGWGTSPRPQRRQLGHGKSPALSTREPPSLSIPVTFYVPAPRIC